MNKWLVNKWIRLSACFCALAFTSIMFFKVIQSHNLAIENVDDKISIQTDDTKPNPPQQLPASPEQQKPVGIEGHYRMVSNNAQYPTLASRVAQMKSRRTQLNVTAEQVLDAMNNPAWRSSRILSEIANSNSDEYASLQKEAISLNKLKIESVMPGDTLSLLIPQLDKQVEVFITRVNVPENTEKLMIIGKISGALASNYVVITQDKQHLTAGIKFENEHFLVQANGDTGWIMASEALFNEQDFTPLKLSLNQLQ